VQGQTVYIEADVEEELLENAVIEVYDIAGTRADLLYVQGRTTSVSIRYVRGVYVFIMKGNNGFRKELKVIVE